MRYRIDWTSGDATLSVREATPAEIRAAAPVLAASYDDPHNAAMMGHDEPFDAEEVVEHYADLADEGGHGFLLFENDVLVGDADLRGVTADHAELAIMLLPRETQSRGLGTRFCTMIHAYAFRTLGLSRLYVAILPGNAASQRLFARLGYVPDDSPDARALVDDDSEVTLSLDASTFEHAASIDDVRIEPRA